MQAIDQWMRHSVSDIDWCTERLVVVRKKAVSLCMLKISLLAAKH